jgi:hypothetical protein
LFKVVLLINIVANYTCKESAAADKCSLLNLPAGRQVFGFVVLICIAVLGSGVTTQRVRIFPSPLLTHDYQTQIRFHYHQQVSSNLYQLFLLYSLRKILFSNKRV